MNKYIKSPLNYTGGKYKILDDIIPCFPKNIGTFVDLFGGGFNVGININSDKIIYNDHNIFLAQMFEYFKQEGINIIKKIHSRIQEFELSDENQEGYLALRREYNKNRVASDDTSDDTILPLAPCGRGRICRRVSSRANSGEGYFASDGQCRNSDSLDLFILTCYSFNHQIRFNSKHEFNTPFGKNRSEYNKTIEENLINFINSLQSKNIEFYSQDFTEADILKKLGNSDFVYCDPPYLISNASYNDGKRGFKNWGEKEEEQLLDLLDRLNHKGVKFALSNVLVHKGLKNTKLIEWSKKYNIKHIEKTYNNSNYQRANKDKETKEVLIYNYSIM